MISSRLYLTVGKMSGWYFTLAGVGFSAGDEESAPFPTWYTP